VLFRMPRSFRERRQGEVRRFAVQEASIVTQAKRRRTWYLKLYEHQPYQEAHATPSAEVLRFSSIPTAARTGMGEPYTNADVVRMSVGVLTEEDVGGIGNGAVADPTVGQIAALAAVFGVPAS
jgi:hypothetical protein